MRIVFLTSRLPYPPYRGDKLRSWNFIKQLSRSHEVYLISFIQHASEREYIDKLQEVCKEVITVKLPTFISWINCLLAVFTDRPFQVAYYRSRKMSSIVEKARKRLAPDVIHTHLIRMAEYVVSARSVPRILDLTDAISLYLQRFRNFQKNPIIRYFLGVESRRIERYERIMLEFDSTIVCSHFDRDFLKRRVATNTIHVIFNGVDIERFSEGQDPQQQAHRIIFTGNMTYYPNIDGATYFVKEVFPLIKKMDPCAKLYVVGQNPPKSVRRCASEDIIVTGFVEDIRHEYLRSTVAVSPIRFGAGGLNKVLEPMALGIPVVATRVGVEGLNLSDGKEILIAESSEAFAESVVRLLKNAELRMRISTAAKQKVHEQFSTKNTVKELEKVYLAALKYTKRQTIGS